MSDFPDIAPGADVAERLFNSRWVNQVTRATNPSALRSNGATGGSRLAYLPVDVLNDTGAAIDAEFPILRLTTPVVTVADNANAPYNDADFKGDTPDASTGAAFVIVQGPIGDGVARPAALLGLSWCKVDVVSSSDTHAAAIDGDNTKLRSGSSGVEIKWKESGTGDKWALVLLGGGGTGGVEPIYGKIKLAVPAEGIVEDAIEAYAMVNGVLVALLDDEDNPVLYGAKNPNSYSNIVIYEDPAADNAPIMVNVWGFPFSYNFEEDPEEEPRIKTVMVVWNPPGEPALEEGFIKNPAAVGQVSMHDKDSNKRVMRAGPCGGA